MKRQDGNTEAFKALELQALRGDPEAQNRLGRCYLQGRGVIANDELAVQWFTCAAERGHSDAQNNLGMMFSKGRGVREDAAAALKLYRQAAEQGHEVAQFNLGNLFYEGRGAPVDRAEALRWYMRSAAQGDPAAQTNVGIMYLKGEGTSPDLAQAMHWATLGAAQDDAARSAVEAVRHAGFTWLGPRRPGARRILYLRAYMGVAVDQTFIALVALAVTHVGRLVVIGTEDGENRLRTEWGETPQEYTFDRLVEYIPTDADSWRAIAVREVSRADCIVVHPSPDGDYPSWVSSSEYHDPSVDTYADPIEDSATGEGLLRELSYLDILQRLDQTILLCEEKNRPKLKRLAEIAALALGDTFLVRAGELKWRRGVPKLGALNRMLANLTKARSVVTFRDCDLAAESPWLTLRLEAAIVQILGESRERGDSRAPDPVSVSHESRRLPPDQMLKVIAFTNVEDLLFIPRGEITEVDPKRIAVLLTGDAQARGCPYCYAPLKSIFFYTDSGGGAIRGKCQTCGRRSTVVDDMLLDT